MSEADVAGEGWGREITEDEFCRRIDSLRHLGKITKAMGMCEDWLADIEPASGAGVHIAYGRVLVAAGLAGQAVGEFEAARHLDNESELPFAGLIAAYSLLQERDKREREAAEGLARFGRSTVIRVALGRARLAAYEYQEALDVLAEADRQPGADEMTARWHLTARVTVHGCEEADGQPAGEAAVEQHRGLIYLGHGQHAKAARCFDSVREIASRSASALAEKARENPEGKVLAGRALSGLALVAMSEGYVRKAETYSEKAAQLLPDLAGILLDEACVLVTAGKYEAGAAKAREAYDKASCHPDIVKRCVDVLRRAYRLDDAARMAEEALGRKIVRAGLIRTALACVLIEKGAYAEAAREARLALRQRPDDPDIVPACISVLRQAFQFDEAVQEATRALNEKIRQSWHVRTALAWVFSDMGDYPSALEEVERALEDKDGSRSDPDARWLLLSKIDFLRGARLFEQAERAASDALELDQDNPEVLLALAWVLSDQDREEEAAACAARALGKDGNNPAALVARVYFLRWARKFGTEREPGEAQRAALDALRERPGDPEVLTACGWLLSDLNDHETAQEHVNKALRTDKYNSWALSCKIIFHTVAGHYAEAEKAAADAVHRRPDDPRLHVAAGWMYGDLDRYDTALGHFNKALERNGYDVEALEWRIAARRSSCDREGVLNQARDAVRLRPFDPGPRLELGRLHDDRRDFTEALRSFQQVLDPEKNNIAATIARSATLRAQHRQDEAEREVDAVRRDGRSGNRELLTELGWIYHDQLLPARARQEFKRLHDESRNDRERAAACYGIGWADMLEGKYHAAAERFRAAEAWKAEDVGYLLGRAWANIARRSDERLNDAEDCARRAYARRADPLTETCLGVIAFRRRRLAEAEGRFKRALELDPSGSPVDLGALYAWMGRYDEAETELVRALDRDPVDVFALTELGYLYLQPAYESHQAAEQAFRRALASWEYVPAAAGLAQVLVKTGRAMEAESLLRKAVRWDNFASPWQADLALAQLLVQQGSSGQDPGQFTEARVHAEKAIGRARQAEGGMADGNPAMAELQFTAALASSAEASVTAEPGLRYLRQRRALRYLEECLRLDRDHVPARAARAALKRAQVSAGLSILAAGSIAVLSLALLALEWTLVLVSKKGSITVAGTDTPVLVGLFAVSFLLPTLIRLKMPGFEAEMQPKLPRTVPEPVGLDALGPGRFTVMPEPTGQIPRRGTDAPHYLGKAGYPWLLVVGPLG